jgi:hypothetical protein
MMTDSLDSIPKTQYPLAVNQRESHTHRFR